MSVCPSVHKTAHMEQLGSCWIGFCEILYWAVLFKSGMKLKFFESQTKTADGLHEDVCMFAARLVQSV
jgi:hypothetical protein